MEGGCSFSSLSSHSRTLGIVSISRLSHNTLLTKCADMFSFMNVGKAPDSLPEVLIAIFQWSFRTFESSPVGMSLEDDRPLYRVANWLVHTALFEQAWYAVCFGPSAWSWWWSQQLCLFTAGAWTIFLVLEGKSESQSL